MRVNQVVEVDARAGDRIDGCIRGVGSAEREGEKERRW